MKYLAEWALWDHQTLIQEVQVTRVRQELLEASGDFALVRRLEVVLSRQLRVVQPEAGWLWPPWVLSQEVHVCL